ncbi:HAD-IA family hydrolase [Vibrio gazogenes]|uniref:Sugar-phosphatase n=1 Tax=Vibrio gazogenes DSM 21264 = NBRC 103151 TaxID=1123492 RepID=A0A1M4XUI0_VIBGA|nr:HAD-IA family hydrolase [Vibrio gazogenes]USP12873.1 HAD-IA family hydrolase [Vibrio gazogenes]SHE97254.1 sugar-phosphatase [Vibrio gazogenes DSM 21264] [Vibrio gazogenes DSM 21264 = NBRC 103151]SJN57908.1 Sugar phosphatase YfbT [Vibrio gazogenes]
MSTEFHFRACLFDLDGTLIDSIAAVNRAWTVFATRQSLDPAYILHHIHGRPASESVAEFMAGQSQTEIEREIAWLKDAESQDTAGIVPITGAIDFLHQLNHLNVPWAIVTSGNESVAYARIKAAKIPKPDVVITADQITRGKPDPEPYQLGAQALGFTADQCLVFEDAIAGVQSGLAAGCPVIGLLTQVQDAQALLGVSTISDYTSLTLEQDTEGFKLHMPL